MKQVSVDQANDNFGALLDETCATGNPVQVVMDDERSAVIMSLEAYNGLQETLHLMSSPANASRLLSSIAQLERK